MLTDFQKRKLRHYFKLWDYERRGSIDLNDFMQLNYRILHIQGYTPDSPEYQAMCQYSKQLWEDLILPFADPNNGGRVTADEYLQFCDHMLPQVEARAASGEPDPYGAAFFQMMDTDGDGKAAYQDWAKFILAWGIKGHVIEHFQRMDTDGDGYITLADLMQLYHQFLFSDDPNDPGNYLFGSID